MSPSVRDTAKELLSGTALYGLLRACHDNLQLRAWEKSGQPIPPPHIVKQRTVRALATACSSRVLVETGTFKGDMVYAMTPFFDRIYSIELSSTYFERAQRRFRGQSNVRLLLGDSGLLLRDIVSILDRPAIFWLDGHYSGGSTAKGEQDCPLLNELAHIASGKDLGHAIAIDDARYLTGDDGYPTVAELRAWVMNRWPQARVRIEHDIVSVATAPGCSES